MNQKKYYFIIIIAFISLFSGCGKSSKADLILINGKIATVDKAFTIHQSLAIGGDRILFVGDNESVKKFTGKNTRTVDLKGKLVVPGMVDSHGHPFNLGQSGDNDSFSVRGSKNYQEVVARVAAKIKTMKPGEWLIGGGWYQDDWEDNSLPVHDPLSAVSPENPIFLYRRGGNSCLVNRKALEIAGITRGTTDPYGGKIIRKPNGDPTGVLVNMGNNMVKKHFPKPNRPLSWYEEGYLNAAKMCNEVGLTGWHDAGIDPIYITAYKSLVDKKKLTIRVYAMLQNPREGSLEEYFRKHRVVNYGGDHFFSVRSVKVFFDGALGSRGAAFFTSYDDDPQNTGVFEIPPEHLLDVCRAALKVDMQVCPHAIGIRGNSVYLDMVDKALAENPVNDHRFRSEHAEVVRPEDVKRFARLGVIPAMQPIHCTEDMVFIEHRIGKDRCQKSASPWRGFIEAGCVIPCGSDFAIYSHNPLTGFYSAVTRQDPEGLPAEGWFPEQRMTREEALRGYTIWTAYASFQEEILGSLEKGKLADLVILDRDILTIEPKEILSTRVLATIVGGVFVYQPVAL